MIAVLFVAIVATGCGGGGSSTSAESSSSSTASSSTDAKTSSKETATKEASSEFAGKGPNGEIASFGKEATAAEREAASEVLEMNLQARGSGDWTTQCATLLALTIKEIEKANPGSHGCAQVLADGAAKAKPAFLENSMSGPIDALRVQGNQGFALYHGTKEKDYVMTMGKEDGKWKVASIVTQEVP